MSCGAPYAWSKGGPVRCVPCAELVVAAQKNATAARRAAACRVGDKGINWSSVGERDDWRCRWCEITCNRTGGTHKNPRGATVDHVIPLAKGGTHAWDNVVCSCWKCNTEKRDLLLDADAA